jgi:hypothetical protein
VLTLALRVNDYLFPSERTLTLALFAALPIAWFGLWLARRHRPEAKMLQLAATIALAGGALSVTARACAVEEASPPVVPLALYAWAHVALLVAIAGIVESPALLLGALGVSAGVLLMLAFGFNPRHLSESLLIVLVPMLAFWALPFLGPRLRGARTRPPPSEHVSPPGESGPRAESTGPGFASPRPGTLAWTVPALSLLIHFPFLYATAKDSWSSGALGASSMACGLLALGALVLARRTRAEPEVSIDALLGGTSLLFFTATFPILFSDEWLTVAWALEAAALAWLHRHVKHQGLLVASGLLGAGTLTRLLLNPAVLEYHPRSGTPIVNWWLYTYGVSALALLGAWWLLQRDEEARKAPRLAFLSAFFAFAGGLLLFVLLNIEIADFYSTGSSVTFQFSGGGFEQDMTYTLSWGVFALALFGLGMGTRSRPARVWAIVLVCVTAAKGALHDVWSLGSLYRVGAIVGLAFTLLAVSYLTQRFVIRVEDRPGGARGEESK